MAIRHVSLLAIAVLAGGLSEACAAPAGSEKPVRIVNPYAQVDWSRTEFIHSFTHQHSRDPQVQWDMGFRHLPVSNYYPSRPVYPLSESFLKRNPEALGSPNAEHHSMTDSSYHFCTPGSYYTVGYGQTPKFKADTSPIEHVFKDLNLFDAARSPWQGVYRLDLRMAAKAGREAVVIVTVEGAHQVSHKTFAIVGDGLVQGQRLTAKSPEAMYLRTESATVCVRLDFDPATTQITRFRLMQGTNRPWRDAFRAALDGTLEDAAGRPIEGLRFADGGGITINHPGGSVERLLEALDFDPRVLGIEVWNQHEGFGGPKSNFYQLWDGALRAGRRCYGFFVKDHVWNGCGRNVLLLSGATSASREDREHDALRAYREGRFFGLLGALAVDGAGKLTAPYDKTDFRFTRIVVQDNAAGEPTGVEVWVDGADRHRRPNTQIRFVTDAGVASVTNGQRGFFEFPRDATGRIACQYVRVEAFAYPNTHQAGEPLTAQAVAAMSVHEISRIHDRLGLISTAKLDPPGQSPIPIVDMIFSQPILVRQ